MKHVKYVFLTALLATSQLSDAQLKTYDKASQNIIECLSKFHSSYEPFENAPASRVNNAFKSFNKILNAKSKFIASDEELASEKIKKRILTQEGQFTCVYNKKYKNSVYILYQDLVDSNFVYKKKPGVLNFNNSIECSKSKPELSFWNEIIERGISLSPFLYNYNLSLSRQRGLNTGADSAIGPERYIKDGNLHKGSCLKQSNQHIKSYQKAQNKIRQIYSSPSSDISIQPKPSGAVE